MFLCLFLHKIDFWINCKTMGDCDFTPNCTSYAIDLDQDCSFKTPNTTLFSVYRASLPYSFNPSTWVIHGATEQECNTSFVFFEGAISCFEFNQHECTVVLPNTPPGQFLSTTKQSAVVRKRLPAPPYYSIVETLFLGSGKVSITLEKADECLPFPPYINDSSMEYIQVLNSNTYISRTAYPHLFNHSNPFLNETCGDLMCPMTNQTLPTLPTEGPGAFVAIPISLFVFFLLMLAFCVYWGSKPRPRPTSTKQ